MGGAYSTCFSDSQSHTNLSISDVLQFASDCAASNFTAPDPDSCNTTIVMNPASNYAFIPLYWGTKGALVSIESLRNQSWINRKTEELRLSMFFWNAPAQTAIRTVLVWCLHAILEKAVLRLILDT